MKSDRIHFSGVSPNPRSPNPRGGKVGDFMVRHRDRYTKGSFICYANTTSENIFGTSKFPLTNPTQSIQVILLTGERLYQVKSLMNQHMQEY